MDRRILQLIIKWLIAAAITGFIVFTSGSRVPEIGISTDNRTGIDTASSEKPVPKNTDTVQPEDSCQPETEGSMDSTEGAFTDRIKDVEGISKEELGNKFEQNSYDQYFTEDTGIGSHTAKSPEELISSRKERLSAGRMFKLENLESHLFMEAVGNEMYTAPFAAAIVEDSGSDSYYKRAYTFNATENGWFQIIPLSNIGLAAELSQSGASGEYEIFFCPAREGDMSQGWRLVFVEEGGYYNIQSVMEESLFLAESASEKGSRLTVRPGADEDPAQRWQLWPLIGVSVKDPEWLRLIYGEESTLYEENTEIPETEASENPE